jgi:hypothetical protein
MSKILGTSGDIISPIPTPSILSGVAAMTKTAVRTPGDEGPTTDEVIEGAEAAGLEVTDAPKPKAGKKLTIEERMDLLEQENARLRENQMPPKAAKVDPYADLPDISEYTGKNQHKQKELSAAVLTKQGWIAPAHLGANPAALNELQKRGMAATSVK